MKKNLNSTLQNWWLPCLILFIAACQNEADKTAVSSPNKFADQTLVQIYDYQDKRDTDSLLQFFDDENPAYRAAAAEAFGSVQDTVAIPMLTILLADNHAKVRRAAAYALGQMHDSSAIKPLSVALDNEDSLYVRRELYESLGKVITADKLEWLNRRAAETQEEKAGLAWGLYRAGIRNVHDQLSTGTAIALLNSTNDYEVRLGAAHFLARSANLNLQPFLPQLIEAATTDSAANVRMAAVTAIARIQSGASYQVLATQCLKDHDYRVRVNAIRGLTNANFDASKEFLYQALEDENPNVVVATAQIINSKDLDATFISELALKQKNLRAKALLLGTALQRTEEKNNMSEQIKEEYKLATDSYYKAGLLTALGHYIPNYEFIITEVFKAEQPVISTAGANALVAMRHSNDFPDELKPAFADIFKELLASADIALIDIVARELGDPDMNYLTLYQDDFGFLYEAKEQLELPKDNEALQSLEAVIALFEGKESVPEITNAFNHPINWDLVKTIPTDQKVKVFTEKGDFTLRLFVEDAPGSVANFYTLAQNEYFTGKTFHRVVPNFVIQGGCNRGDGYGGEDYSIRSEFANLRYQTGSVGMASAGKDTEGTQWFATHSPTPHLDGRYTIFAQVEDGMDIVHQIEEGDLIKRVEILP